MGCFLRYRPGNFAPPSLSGPGSRCNRQASSWRVGCEEGTFCSRRAFRLTVLRVWHGGTTDLSKSDEYRRLARECLELASTFAAQGRATLIEMARIWTRLADEAAQPVVQQQQQQQSQPKKDGDEE
jgi:hypothetical protein